MSLDRNREIGFGKYRGMMLCELPNNYLEWMAANLNEGAPSTQGWRGYAAAELDYRTEHGITIESDSVGPAPRSHRPRKPRTRPGEPVLEPKAIDSASILLFDRYLDVRENWDETPGFYTWLAKFVQHHFNADAFFQIGNDWYAYDDPDYRDIAFEIKHPGNSNESGIVLVDVIKGDPPAQTYGKKSKSNATKKKVKTGAGKKSKPHIVADDDPYEHDSDGNVDLDERYGTDADPRISEYDDYATSLPPSDGEFDPTVHEDEEPPF